MNVAGATGPVDFGRGAFPWKDTMQVRYSVKAHYLDASALVKLVADDSDEEPGRDVLRKYYHEHSNRYATSYCITEALFVGQAFPRSSGALWQPCDGTRRNRQACHPSPSSAQDVRGGEGSGQRADEAVLGSETAGGSEGVGSGSPETPARATEGLSGRHHPVFGWAAIVSEGIAAESLSARLLVGSGRFRWPRHPSSTKRLES
jgi:hypothetical protein